tara:strand:- start:5865 stop:7100 length:1236 start_codon:yes stop_codon:yes gene_type:complete
MNILFIHQNFPGQFKHLVPALLSQGHKVSALTSTRVNPDKYPGISVYHYSIERSSSQDIHPWIVDFETKVIRAEACFRTALVLRSRGYYPDLIISHHGWGESLFLKDVWPNTKLALYCEFYYQPEGFDVGFDPEFSAVATDVSCNLRLKNLNNLLHFDLADAAISPTFWQASSFPLPFRNKISVIHDGINTSSILPNPNASITLNNSLQLTNVDEVVTFVNRNLEPYRGYHSFMRSLPTILRERPNAHILIVGGDGLSYGSAHQSGKSWKSIFIQEVRPSIRDTDWARVHFLGSVSYQQFITILQISSVHVYLTYPFVLSWSLLEAMSAGCSVVASNTGPLREVISDHENGVLVDFFSPSDISDKVCSLLANKDLGAELGQKARKFAQENYDLVNICLPRQIDWINSVFSL